QASEVTHDLTDAEGYDQEYFLNFVLLHEQMHDEAITYTRQTLSYPAPAFAAVNKVLFARQYTPLTQADNDLTCDAEIPGGKFTLGSVPERGFVFDNEQPAHEVKIASFVISKTAVTNGEFKNFVEDDGYRRGELWTDEGSKWRTAVNAEHP